MADTTNNNTTSDVTLDRFPTYESLIADVGGVEFEEREESYNEYETGKIDTINNIGSIISSRMNDGLGASLKRMENVHGYTPVSESTRKLYQELGISLPFGGAVGRDGKIAEGSDGWDDSFNLPDDEKGGKDKDRFSTSIGQSVVLNSPFQFNKNDDVRSDTYFPKLGRVFNEKIYSNYPIAVFEVGKIKYNKNFGAGASTEVGVADDRIASRIRGDDGFLGNTVNVLKTVLKTSWKLVTLPITMPGDFLSKLLGLNKYAVFEHQTALFQSYMDDMLHTVAAIMGLLIPSEEDPTYDASSSTFDPAPFERDDSKFGHDQYAGRLHQLRFKNILPFKGMQSNNYIPFLINKDISISENIGNSTTQNPIQSEMNGLAAQNQAADINGGANTVGANIGQGAWDAFVAQKNTMIQGLFRGESGTVISGEGRIALPEVWTESSFSRTVSMSFKFQSPYGNDLAIFENTIMPFLTLFCMGAPRQIGGKTYTSPFIIRVQSKGLFNVPMGIVESLSVERGDSKNDWTKSDRPRTIKCTLNIKDISPTMMMTMNKGLAFPLFQGNDGFTQYLNTLGGLSIHESSAFVEKFDRWKDKVVTRVGNVIDFIRNPVEHVKADDSNFMLKMRNVPIVSHVAKFKAWAVGSSETDDIF